MALARILATMWWQRWQALREDKGASTIEYTLLVIAGVIVAGIIFGIVRTYVINKGGQIGGDDTVHNP